MLRELHGPDFPTIKELILRASFVFLNSNEHLEIARPISAKTKFIGGIAVEAPTPLEPV